MKFSTIPLLFLFTSILNGQSLQLQWEKTYGEKKQDQATTIIPTSDQHLMMIGFTQPEGRFDLDVLVMKLNQDGEVIWEKTFGDNSIERANDIIEMQDGSYLIAADIIVDNLLTNTWLIQIDSAGDLIWERKYKATYNQNAKSILQTTAGQIIMAGSQEKIEVINNDQAIVPYGFISQLNKAGEVQWTKLLETENFQSKSYGSFKTPDNQTITFFNAKGEAINKVMSTKDGGFLLAGHTLSKAKNGLATDGWLCKTNALGEKIWDVAIGQIGGDDLLDLWEDEEGNFYISGERYDKPKGLVSFWLLKFSESGQQLFEKYYNDGNVCTGAKLLPLDHYFLLAGASNNSQGFINPDTITQEIKKFKEDVWLLITDKKGNALWQKTFGGTEEDKASSLCQTSDGHIFVAGYTYSKGNGLKDIILYKFKYIPPKVP